MDRGFRFLVASIAIVVALFSFNSDAHAADGTWSFGTARAKITPEQPMWMSGYGGRNHPSEGKLTELWAKALVLQDTAGQKIALITLDLVGIGRPTMQAVCDDLFEKHGLKREQIAICTSHTHTGPAMADNLRPLHYLVVDRMQQQLIDDYTDRLKNEIVAVVGRAMKDLKPCQLSSGSGQATFAVNRRNNRPESDVPQLRAEGKLVGPIDHDVPVLAVRDSDGKLKAVVFGYACHATVLSLYEWSGDYPGFAQIELEKAHPGCQAMFWAGCGADQNPLPRRLVEHAKEYGRQLAGAVDRVMDGEMQPVEPKVQTAYREIELPLDELPTSEMITKDTESTNKFVAARARYLLEKIESDGKLAQSYPYPIQTWNLGDDIHWVVLGGEVVVDFALRLKREFHGTNTWVAGYANDVMAYIPSLRVLKEGGYEGGGAMVYYGLPTVWAASVEEDIVKEVHRQSVR